MKNTTYIIIIAVAARLATFSVVRAEDFNLLDQTAPTITVTQTQKAGAIQVLQHELDRVGHDGGIVVSSQERDRVKAVRDRDTLILACKAGVEALKSGRPGSMELADVLLSSGRKAERFESPNPECVKLARRYALACKAAAAAISGTLKVSG